MLVRDLHRERVDRGLALGQVLHVGLVVGEVVGPGAGLINRQRAVGPGERRVRDGRRVGNDLRPRPVLVVAGEAWRFRAEDATNLGEIVVDPMTMPPAR